MKDSITVPEPKFTADEIVKIISDHGEINSEMLRGYFIKPGEITSPEPKVINVSGETAEKVKEIFESNQLKPTVSKMETVEPILIAKAGECDKSCGENHCDTNGCSSRVRFSAPIEKQSVQKSTEQTIHFNWLDFRTGNYDVVEKDSLFPINLDMPMSKFIAMVDNLLLMPKTETVWVNHFKSREYPDFETAKFNIEYNDSGLDYVETIEVKRPIK